MDKEHILADLIRNKAYFKAFVLIWRGNMPRTANYYYLKAYFLWRIGLGFLAERALRKAFKLNREEVSFYALLAQILLDRRQFKKAKWVLEYAKSFSLNQDCQQLRIIAESYLLDLESAQRLINQYEFHENNKVLTPNCFDLPICNKDFYAEFYEARQCDVFGVKNIEERKGYQSRSIGNGWVLVYLIYVVVSFFYAVGSLLDRQASGGNYVFLLSFPPFVWFLAMSDNVFSSFVGRTHQRKYLSYDDRIRNWFFIVGFPLISYCFVHLQLYSNWQSLAVYLLVFLICGVIQICLMAMDDSEHYKFP